MASRRGTPMWLSDNGQCSDRVDGDEQADDEDRVETRHNARDAMTQEPFANRGEVMTVTTTHHHADLGDVILHYISAGEGFPVVLLHGIPQTSHEWRYVIPPLASKYKVTSIISQQLGRLNLGRLNPGRLNPGRLNIREC